MKAGVPGKLDSEPLRPNKRDIDWILSKMPYNFDRKNLTFVVTPDGIENEIKTVKVEGDLKTFTPSRIELLIHPNDWTRLLAEFDMSSGYFKPRERLNEEAIGTICGIKVLQG